MPPRHSTCMPQQKAAARPGTSVRPRQRAGTTMATAAVDALLWGDTSRLVTLGEIQAAQIALREYPDVLRTPMLPSWPLELSSASSANGSPELLSLKLESLQTTGSFKLRGMRYKLHTSDVAQLRAAGVVTLSSGAVSIICTPN